MGGRGSHQISAGSESPVTLEENDAAFRRVSDSTIHSKILVDPRQAVDRLHPLVGAPDSRTPRPASVAHAPGSSPSPRDPPTLEMV